MHGCASLQYAYAASGRPLLPPPQRQERPARASYQAPTASGTVS